MKLMHSVAGIAKKMSVIIVNDYTDVFSTGNRQPRITTTSTFTVGGGAFKNLVDGNNNNIFYWNAETVTTDSYLRFQLTTAKAFNEAKWYQSTTASHGTYQWRGSNDASSWTTIGSSFVVGGATTQTQTELSGNTTAYSYYELRGVSGTNSSAPFLQEIEFKVYDVPAPASVNDYLNGYSVDTRTDYITVTTTVGYVGTPGQMVDGNENQTGFFFTGVDIAGNYIRFALAAARVFTEAKWIQQTTNSHATYQWQGSNDASSWTNIGSPFVLGGATTQTITELSGNTTAYTYYQMLYQSGTDSSNPYLYEIRFKVLRTE